LLKLRKHNELINIAEEQEEWLVESIVGLQHIVFYMHQALALNNIQDAMNYLRYEEEVANSLVISRPLRMQYDLMNNT
jgi:hypothetical protein